MFTGTRSRLLLIGLVLLAVGAVALSWFLGVDPQLKSLERTKADIVQEKAINDIEQIAVEALRVQNENIDELRDELEEYRSGIPETYQQPALLRMINSAASRADVRLTGVQSGEILSYVAPEWQQPAPPIGQDRLVGLTYELTAEGDASDLRNFVANVQRLARYVTVSTASYDTDDAGLTELTLTGTAWVLLSPEAVAANNAAETPAAPAPNDAEEADE